MKSSRRVPRCGDCNTREVTLKIDVKARATSGVLDFQRCAPAHRIRIAGPMANFAFDSSRLQTDCNRRLFSLILSEIKGIIHFDFP